MRLVDVVGNTSMIELATGVARPGIRLFAKLEGNNPAGSVKDRPARSMLMDPLRSGRSDTPLFPRT